MCGQGLLVGVGKRRGVRRQLRPKVAWQQVWEQQHLLECWQVLQLLWQHGLVSAVQLVCWGVHVALVPERGRQGWWRLWLWWLQAQACSLHQLHCLQARILHPAKGCWSAP